MFGIGSFFFKEKAKKALKGNWQTAMLVAFFSGIFLTAIQVYQLRFLQLDTEKMTQLLSVAEYSELWALFGLTRNVLVGFGALVLAALLFTPALSLGSNHYFLQRIKGEELGFGGILSRFCIFFRAIWLYLLIAIKVFLWSLVTMIPVLLLIFFVPNVSLAMLRNPFLTSLLSIGVAIPSVLANLRYAMAPYVMAEKPDTGAWQSIETSKQLMKNQKMNYLALSLSFIGWFLISSLVQMLLQPVSFMAAMVAQLFMQTWISAYMNAAMAAFYTTVSQSDGLKAAMDELQKMFRQAGVEFHVPHGDWQTPAADSEAAPKEEEPSPEQPENSDSGNDSFLN